MDPGSRVVDSGFQTQSIDPSKSVDSGFHAMDCGFHARDSGFQSLTFAEFRIPSHTAIKLSVKGICSSCISSCKSRLFCLIIEFERVG